MSGTEFEIINRYLTGLGADRDDIAVDIGDDCAITSVPEGHQLAISVDTLVAGVHFFLDADPYAIGFKSLAVSLSDLAAMGATPAWATLALTLPRPDSQWLSQFASGLDSLARQHGLRLIGGDITRGPLTISIQIIGFLKDGQKLPRRGANIGDIIFVSGQIGDAGLALRKKLENIESDEQLRRRNAGLFKRLDYPIPRVTLGCRLHGLATSAIDLSDGLAADLGHILEQSGVGATLQLDQLPLTDTVNEIVTTTGDYSLPLTSGDDYELCFTTHPNHQTEIESIARELGCPITAIGVIEKSPGLRLRQVVGDSNLRMKPLKGPAGFDHFSE